MKLLNSLKVQNTKIEYKKIAVLSLYTIHYLKKKLGNNSIYNSTNISYLEIKNAVKIDILIIITH